MPLAAAVAVTGVVGAVASSNAQKSAAKKAANAQKDASDKQIALQREQLARAEQVAAPYRAAGTQADTALDARWGGAGLAGNGAMASAYGTWGQAANARPGSAYDPYSGAPNRTTQAGAPQVARPDAYSMPAPPQPQPAAWHASQVDRTRLPALPAPMQQQPAPSGGGQAGAAGPYAGKSWLLDGPYGDFGRGGFYLSHGMF